MNEEIPDYVGTIPRSSIEFKSLAVMDVLRDFIFEALEKISANNLSINDISFKISAGFDVKTIIDDISGGSFPFTDEGIQDFIYFRKKRELKDF